MKFFNREEEIGILRDIREKSRRNARFTVVTGRRRVGKTQLIKHALGDEPYLYFYVSRKSERDLCAGFQSEMTHILGIPFFGAAERFEDLFKAVVEVSKSRPVTLVIDEFQEFFRINESVFSVMANIWDDAQKDSKMNLIVCGSVNRLMTKIFKDNSEPLYSRHTNLLHIEPFRISVLKGILSFHSPGYTSEDLLSLWTMTGGVAKYVELLMDDGAYTKEKMLSSVFRRDSAYLDEGMAILVQEFGKDYGIYFSIMSAIASGKTEYSQIKNYVGEDVGAHLAKLEQTYSLVRRKVPVFADPGTKHSMYEIDDCFFRYWFRFVWKSMYLKELQRFDAMREYAERDYSVFSGHALEQYFKWKFIEEMRYTKMDAWWDRRGENEIDLVCDDETGNTLDFYEIKRDAARIDLKVLEFKAQAFLARNSQLRVRNIACKGLSMKDM